MGANASSFACLHNSTIDFVKHYLCCNSASKSSLIRALQGHRGFKQPSLSCAADKIEDLFLSCQIEVIGDMCRWNYNHIWCLQGPERDLPSTSTAVSRKRRYFLCASRITFQFLPPSNCSSSHVNKPRETRFPVSCCGYRLVSCMLTIAVYFVYAQSFSSCSSASLSWRYDTIWCWSSPPLPPVLRLLIYQFGMVAVFGLLELQLCG